MPSLPRSSVSSINEVQVEIKSEKGGVTEGGVERRKDGTLLLTLKPPKSGKYTAQVFLRGRPVLVKELEFTMK